MSAPAAIPAGTSYHTNYFCMKILLCSSFKHALSCALYKTPVISLDTYTQPLPSSCVKIWQSFLLYYAAMCFYVPVRILLNTLLYHCVAEEKQSFDQAIVTFTFEFHA